ncbi:hypothetical protein ACOMHN_027921 [Nucella lapillus]
MTLLPSPLKLLMMLAMTSFCDGVTLIDLTYRLKKGEAMSWPSLPDYNFTILSRQMNLNYNVWLESNKFEITEHTGTHMDAPAHMVKGKWRMHDIPLDKFSGPGVVVNMAGKVKDNEVYQLTVEDMKAWESEHGTIPEKAVVLVNFGWGSRYPDRNRVFNTNSLNDPNTYKFPSVSEEVAKWMVEERTIVALGTDTPSPDTSHGYRLPVHLTLLEKDVLIIENVANLDDMPPKGTTVILGALNIYDGSGAPMRLLAFSAGWRPQVTPVVLAAALTAGMAMVRAALVAP